MNSNFGNFNLKQVAIAVIIAVGLAIWQIFSPALDTATQTGSLIVNWAIVGFVALKAFLTTMVALFLTNSNGQVLTTESGKILGVININK